MPHGTVDDEWRRWIAENLTLGRSEESIVREMVSNGVASDDARHEVRAALIHPYVQGSRRLRERLKKRDWILGVYRRLSVMHREATDIERRDGLDREEFFERFYYANRPVIIAGMLDEWPALRRWSCAIFRERWGEREVEVQFGRESDPDFEINKGLLTKKMRFGDYVDLIERSSPTNDFYMTASNHSLNRRALAELWDDLKPLPPYLDPRSPDDGFLWFGPAGTITPFHHDLTNNLLAQVVGRKRILLVPLHDTPFMYNHLHCFSTVDGKRPNLEVTPAFANARFMQCTLEPGELLFLPIGWWHYVEAIEVSITVAFTNFAAPNDFFVDYTTFGGV
ncbi:Cupin-like domain-containing protein [Trinickia symbiotica]|uniref:Cupin-like domain-containing protein n=1 Tax=Trinickia symbiotica TaxID=863227 RepID=A0A2N7X713_9BURK|nr:cupin-like domain-containing protein [Trinickia symbiotica]PPK42655.1 Cupin-like domain-containing protein [Trinickia symbiotica]